MKFKRVSSYKRTILQGNKMTKILLSASVALLLGTTVTFAETQTAEDAKMEAKYQKDQASAKAALDAADKKLEDDYEKNDPFSQVIADDYKALSEAYYKMGDLQSSIDYALHALKIKMKIRKEDDPVLAKLYFDTGNKYYMHKQHPTAILYMKKSAEIYENSPEKESLALADTYEGIASVFINLEDNAKSLNYAEKCLEIRKKKLKKDDEALQRAQMNVEFLKKELKP